MEATAWSPIVQVAGAPDAPSDVDLAVSGRDVHMHFYAGGGALKYRKSTDEGQTWGVAATVASGDPQLTNTICADGNYVHIFYQSGVNLCHRRSTDGGANFGSETVLFSGSAAHYYRISCATVGGYVHVAWCEHDNSTFETEYLKYRRSTDNGANWESAVQPYSTADANNPSRPALAVSSDGTYVHLCWVDMRDGGVFNQDGQVFTGRSIDSGANWQTEVRLTTGVKLALRSDITCASGAVVAVWQQSHDGTTSDGTLEIYASRSTDNGANYGASVRLTTNSEVDEHAYISSQGSYILIVFTRYLDTARQTYSRFSRNGGSTWETEKAVSTETGTSAPSCKISATYCMAIEKREGTSAFFSRDPINGPPDRGTALDDFNRGSIGSNWTSPGIVATTGGLTISGNVAVCRAASGDYRQGGFWNTPLAFADAFIAVELSAVTAAREWSIYGRLTTTTPATTDGYALAIQDDGGCHLSRIDNGVENALVNVDYGLAVAVGDLAALEMTGSRIRGWIKPSAGAWQVYMDWEDATYPNAGMPGLEFTSDQGIKVTNLWATQVSEAITSNVYTVINGSDEQLVNINAEGIDVDPFSYKDGVLLSTTELAALLDGATFGKKDVAVVADLTGDAAAYQRKMILEQGVYRASS